MSLVLAAVGAAVAALIQSSILPFTAAGGAGLDLVLVLAVVWTMTVGLEGGLIWAFLGGLIIDVLLMRPLGLTAFVLLLPYLAGERWPLHDPYRGKVLRARSTILGQAIHHATEHRAQIAGALATNGIDVIDLDALDVWAYADAEGLGA